jgi:DNA-binding CsgD family transcriptional regulator/tetratricopeptide (TPR) repeat protein
MTSTAVRATDVGAGARAGAGRPGAVPPPRRARGSGAVFHGHPNPSYAARVELLERESQLEQLREAIRRSRREGSIAVISGEPGAGKSALLRAATAQEPTTRVVRGLCDPLETPRPLGPVRDLIAELGADLDVTAFTTPAELGARFMQVIATQPTVVVIEDAQWIDAASVDVLRFLARRIEAAPILLVLTYRPDEIGAGHSVRPLLGDIARHESAATVSVPSLTIAAIRALVSGTGLDAASVLARTGGNPFYVTEIVRHPEEGLPASVRDAVLASTSAVAEDDLEVLRLIATSPDAVDDRLLPVLGIDVPRLRRLEATGLLSRSRRGVGYRHELARLAVEDAVPLAATVPLHARMLDALERQGSGDFALLTHHARAAGDAARTGRYADAAATGASRAGSHTEAVAFLRLAIEYFSGEPVARADLLERLSYEEYMVSHLVEAIEAITDARGVWSAAGDRHRLAAAHARQALIEYYAGDRRQAERHLGIAIEEVESPGYGSAWATRMYLELRRSDARAVQASARVTSDVARKRHDDDVRLRSDIYGAAAELLGGSLAGRQLLLDRADEARVLGYDEAASTGWSNLAAIDVDHRRFREAGELLSRAMPFTVDRDIPLCNQWQTGVRGRLHLLRGRWEAALEDADTVLDVEAAPLAQLWPNIVAALVLMRRGDSSELIDRYLDRAWELARRLDEPAAMLPALSAIAERVWLLDRDDDRLMVAVDVIDEMGELPGVEWAVGDLVVWLARLGRPVAHVQAAEPFALELAGRADDAAELWKAIGSPFEAALAMLDSADEGAAARAVDELDAMGALASADRARGALRARGMTRVPARPRTSTRANPSGLTNRQLDVARLVAQGLTNAEIARRLYISPKTAGHHVSAILAKFGFETRRELIRRAAEMGLA